VAEINTSTLFRPIVAVPRDRGGRCPGPPRFHVGRARVGHAEAPDRTTGTTVVLFDPPSLGAVEVRGGAPGTMHTDALGALGRYGWLSAVFLSGGSTFGLDAATGIRRRLREEGVGGPILSGQIPVVGLSGAILYDLPSDRELTADYVELGYQAAERARDTQWSSGRVGAAAGATVGKLWGRDRAMPGGLGISVVDLPSGGQVEALAVLNSLGNVYDPFTGRPLAGIRGPSGDVLSREGLYRLWGKRPPPLRSPGTTLLVLWTDVELERVDLLRLCQVAHDAVASSIYPSHWPGDGDTVFAVSTSRNPTPRIRKGRDGRFGPSPVRVALETLLLGGMRAAELALREAGRRSR